MAHGGNLALYLCLQIKFYWNNAMTNHVHIAYDCLCDAQQGQVVAMDTMWLANLKIYFMWPFTEIGQPLV